MLFHIVPPRIAGGGRESVGKNCFWGKGFALPGEEGKRLFGKINSCDHEYQELTVNSK